MHVNNSTAQLTAQPLEEVTKMSNSKKTIWLAVASVVGIALASMAYADTVYRSGQSKGMALLTVEASSGQDIYEVSLAVLQGKVRGYRAPQGWFGEKYGPFMSSWTEDYNYRIAAGTSRPGFGIKVTGKGWVHWETYNGNGNFIDQGWIKLKGRG